MSASHMHLISISFDIDDGFFTLIELLAWMRMLFYTHSLQLVHFWLHAICTRSLSSFFVLQ